MKQNLVRTEVDRYKVKNTRCNVIPIDTDDQSKDSSDVATQD